MWLVVTGLAIPSPGLKGQRVADYCGAMSSLASARIVIVGAGVLGLATAAALIRRGARVQVIDPDAGRGSASAVAAGMIAPAMEAALEDATPERAVLYREAAALWPEFAREQGLDLISDGADWMGPREPLRVRLAALKFRFVDRNEALHVIGEGRLDARRALARLAANLGRGQGEAINQKVIRIEPGPVIVTAEGRLDADAVVLAAGWAASAIVMPGGPPLLPITPIKGQIIRLTGSATDAVTRVTRGPQAYIVPAAGGVLVGATMQPGSADCTVDPEISAALQGAAAEILPVLARARLDGAWAGVRGATADGLPLAGPTAAPGVFAALAPRRNGWMLGPMVGEIVAAAIAGEPPSPHAAAFRPDRFGPA